MQRSKSRWRRLGCFTLPELAVVVSVVSSIPIAAYTRAQDRATRTACLANLQQVGQAVQMHVLANDEYPRAAFYPADPANDDNSIRRILQQQGDMSRLMTCPAMPQVLQDKGLNFVYNTDLGGQREPANPSRKWVLTEFTCVSSMAPPPHPGGWNFLFADGHAATHDVLPAKITAIRAEAEAKAKTAN